MEALARSALALTALAILLFPAAGTLSAAEGEGGWFDFENCAMCAPMMAEKGLMEHTDWQHHNISTGMLTVSVVDPAYKEAYARAGMKMHELGAKMAKGEQMPLCGHCKSMHALMNAGAKMDHVQTASGDIMLLTSTDAALIGKIHAHADQTKAELAKMAKTKEGAAH